MSFFTWLSFGFAASTQQQGLWLLPSYMYQIVCTLSQPKEHGGCCSAQPFTEGEGVVPVFTGYVIKGAWSDLASRATSGCRGKWATPSSKPGTENASWKVYNLLLMNLQRPAGMPKHTYTENEVLQMTQHLKLVPAYQPVKTQHGEQQRMALTRIQTQWKP